MNKTLILAALLAASATAGQAQTYGTPAYPDNWQGGPPLAPINQSMGYTAQSQGYYAQPRVQYVEPQETYVQPYYAQPQIAYVQPRVQYLPAQTYGTAYTSRAYGTTYASRAYGTTFTSRAYGTGYTSRAYGTTYASQQPLLKGPPQSRCVVANLNGTALQEGCGMVSINPADVPMLRQKFSAYRPNSGYVLNLPADSDYR